jgi:hypothetical protein
LLNPVFVAKDRLGIPLDQAIDHVIRAEDWTFDACLVDFALGAAVAGWSSRKVRADIREVINDLKPFYRCDERWLFWAEGAFDKETSDAVL